MIEGMTNQQFDQWLETLAQLIEAKAKTPQEAAEIVRDKKTHK
jgi:truncated hemoglobin YjbI